MLLFNREKNSQSSCKCTTQQHSALPILLAQSTQAQKQQSSIICGKYKDIEVICYNQIGMSILLIHAAISSYVVYYCLLHTYMMGGYVLCCKTKEGNLRWVQIWLVNTIWSMRLLMVDQIFPLGLSNNLSTGCCFALIKFVNCDWSITWYFLLH